MIQAVGEYVILEPIVGEVEGMEDGIYLPQTAKDALKPDAEAAMIVSVGSDCPKEIKAGKKALVRLGSCFTLPPVDDGKLYLLTKGAFVAAVL